MRILDTVFSFGKRFLQKKLTQADLARWLWCWRHAPQCGEFGQSIAVQQQNNSNTRLIC
jgi:hypothetical protein